MPLSYEKQDIEKVRSALDKINETYNLQDKDFAEMFNITTATFSVLWKPGGERKNISKISKQTHTRLRTDATILHRVRKGL